MRPRHVVTCVAFLFAISGLAQTRTEFPIVDRSDITDVLEISGAITSVGQSACVVRAQGKNVSGKPILLLIAEVRALVGTCDVHHRYQLDKYFWKQELAPGTTVAFETDNPGSSALQSAPQQAEESAAEGRLIFVEFADGSTVGDESAAKSFFEYRADMLERLSKLVDSYTSGGEEALVKALDEKAGNADVEWQVALFRRLKPRGAIAQIKSMLEGAQMHKAGRTAHLTAIN